MGGMQLDTIMHRLLQVDGYMDKPVDNIPNLLLGSWVGFSECARLFHDELDIVSRNRVGLQLLKCLTTRMADLTNDQTSILLGCSGQLLECSKSFTSDGFSRSMIMFPGDSSWSYAIMMLPVRISPN